MYSANINEWFYKTYTTLYFSYFFRWSLINEVYLCFSFQYPLSNGRPPRKLYVISLYIIKNITSYNYMYINIVRVGSGFRHRWEKGKKRRLRRIVCGRNIDACKKIFMDFRDHSRVKLVAGGNIFPFVCVCIEIRTGNVYLPPLRS